MPEPVLWSLGGILGILVLASAVVVWLRWRRPGADLGELSLRVKTWWFMAGVFALALVLSRTVSLWFFAFLSFLGLKEYLSLIPTRRADRRVLFWAYLSIPVQYYWISRGWYEMFIIFIPVHVFLLLHVRMILTGKTEGFLRAVGALHWGLIITVFFPSHAVYLLFLYFPEEPQRLPGPGLLLYLVFLTQFNDVAQYTFGKLLGHRKVIPLVSPGKTWGGLLGGLGTTLLLASLLGPWLTPLSRGEAAGAGLLIGVGGFFGDLIISALKRDLGIKDSGSILPGHGGLLDRIDSLICTAPLFFHYVAYLHF